MLGTLAAPSFGPVSASRALARRSSPPPALTLTPALVQELLRSFLTLHSSAKLLSPEGTRAMASVVAWMESYRPAQRPAGTG